MKIESLHIIPDVNNIDDTLKLCEKWNLSFEYNDFFDPKLLDDGKKLQDRIDFYKKLGRPHGADTLHGVFLDMCVNSQDDRIAQISKDRMTKSMEIASELGCKGVVFHTNLIPGFEPDFYLDGWLNKHVEFYKELLSQFPEIKIWVENMFDFKPDMLARLGEAMQGMDNFGVCYDVAHGHIHDLPMENWVSSLAPYIGHLHINDNDGLTDQHRSVGAGTIDWTNYFSLLDSFNISASMLIEVKDIQSQIESLEFLKSKGII